MSTPSQSIRVTPRIRIGLGVVMTALGAFLAVAVTIGILALANDNTTVATPVTAAHAVIASTPQVRFLGPRQQQAEAKLQTGAITPASGAGNATAHYTCLGSAQRCLR